MTEKEEALLDARDERVKKCLTQNLADLSYEIQEAEEKIRQCKKERLRIIIAVQEEKWYNLQGVLSEEDVESLCEIGPAGLAVLNW